MTIFALAEQPPTVRDADRLVWRTENAGAPPATSERRMIAEETPIAFSYEGVSYAVMMGTPADLEDFAVGFSINEGVVASAEEITGIEVVPTDAGILLRLSLDVAPAATFWERRRYLAGPSGCGLCGLETLAQATREPPRVAAGIRVAGEAIVEAMRALPSLQPMHHLTGALHAAAFWTPTDGIVAVREDVGRHNALDKLVGAAARRGLSGAAGAVLLTSRVSVEMVQKTATFGASLLVAVSAPTALAVRAAEAAGITLVAVARRDGFETFTQPSRIIASARPLPKVAGA
jgi:FdhD protein